MSTAEQDLGVEAQRASIEAWARREGVEVVAWHVDQGISGGAELEHRPGLVAALQSVREQRAGLLLVAKRDRLARAVRIAATVEAAAASLGARVVAADGAGNGDGAADEFLRAILDGVSQFERRLIAERTRAALAAKRARGERTGVVPFGYQLGVDGRTLEPNAREQVALRAMVAMRREGLPIRRIAAELETLAYCSRGNRWHPTSVARILQRLEVSP